MNKKFPDNIVFNYDKNKYDSNLKNFPTTVGSQKFEPIKVDSSSSYDASNYFNSKFKELKESYEKLVTEIQWTKILYESEYSFQPITGQNYFLYENKENKYFLSLIQPHQWEKKFIGVFSLQNNGTWKKIIQNEK